jgi:von Willebrand factor type A domain
VNAAAITTLSWPELAALLAQVEWALPWAVALWPLPLLILLLPPHRSRRTALRVPFFALAAQGSGERPRAGAVVLRHGVFGWVLLGLAWTAAVLAAMQPQWVEPPITRIQPTRDWLLAVDLSPSMQTTDFRSADGRPQDRLSVVREVTDDFLTRRREDRIGLLVFGQQPFVQVPFTLDHDAVRALLGEARIGMAGTRTMIGDAIGLAVRVFDESKAPQRTLVLLTDGRDTGSRVPPGQGGRDRGAARRAHVHGGYRHGRGARRRRGRHRRPARLGHGHRRPGLPRHRPRRLAGHLPRARRHRDARARDTVGTPAPAAVPLAAGRRAGPAGPARGAGDGGLGLGGAAGTPRGGRCLTG